MAAEPSYKTVARLSLYRRVLLEVLREGKRHMYSHEIAKAAGVSAAQVRRDLMSVEPTGTPTTGYDIQDLTSSIARLLDDPAGQKVVLVGIGNLGRAVLAYLAGRRPNLSLAAAFDINPDRVDRVIHGCHCYRMEELPAFARNNQIRLAILTVPAAAAQEVADTLVEAGVLGLVNFAPVALHVPDYVYVENLDVTTTLETVAFFARQSSLRNRRT